MLALTTVLLWKIRKLRKLLCFLWQRTTRRCGLPHLENRACNSSGFTHGLVDNSQVKRKPVKHKAPINQLTANVFWQPIDLMLDAGQGGWAWLGVSGVWLGEGVDGDFPRPANRRRHQKNKNPNESYISPPDATQFESCNHTHFAPPSETLCEPGKKYQTLLTVYLVA